MQITYITQIENLKRLFSFNGRLRRSEYWLSLLIGYDLLLILNMFLGSLVSPLLNRDIEELGYVWIWITTKLFSHSNGSLGPTGEPIGMVLVIISTEFIVFSWLVLASAVKRSHDLGRNGFWVLVPFYGLWLSFADSVPGENAYGPNMKEAENSKPATYGIPLFLAVLILSVGLWYYQK